MATSTLIQYLETKDAITGAAQSNTFSNRQQVEIFIAGSTVAVGDAVALDTVTASLSMQEVSLTVRPANATTLLNTIGVVLGSADSDGSLTVGSKIKVCIRGICTAKVASGVAVGTVVRSSGTAGELAAAVPGDAESYTLTGRTITAVSSGVAQVFVHSQYN